MRGSKTYVTQIRNENGENTKYYERRDVHDKDKENFQTNMREFLDERQRQRLEKI